MATAKEEVQKMLNQIPDDASLEDIQYHLYMLDKIQSGLECANSDVETAARIKDALRGCNLTDSAAMWREDRNR